MIGYKHAALIMERPHAQLSAVVAPLSTQNAAFADDHGATLYHDIGTALESEDIDAAVISSPNEFHFDQAMACLGKGIPALVEKPLTDDIRQARDLAKASEDLGVPVLVGHHRTYSPLLRLAREFLNSENFGRLVSVQGSALFYKPADYFRDGPWRTRKGGGPVLINLIHEIGIMRHLCGEIACVAAHVSHAKRGFEVEDSAAILLTFESGALGTFLLSDTAASSKSWEMTAGENPAYPYFPDQNCYHFAGDMGSFDFPSMQYRTYAGRPHRSWWDTFRNGRLAPERRDPLALQLDHFVDVVRDGAAPVVAARDGYLNMLVLEAIMQAASSNHTVDMAGFTAALARDEMKAVP